MTGLMILIMMLSMFGQPSKPIDEVDKSYTVIYNIQDLELIAAKPTSFPQIDLNNALGGHGGNPFTNTNNVQVDSAKQTQAIMNLIHDTVEPEAWGDIVTMQYFHGNLIINAPKRIHDQIK